MSATAADSTVFSIFALLGFFLACVPLYWQFEVWNVGAIWHISLVALSCLNQYFNSVIWAGDAANVAPAFCEISIRLTMAVSIGLPAASLVINRRLLRIVSAPIVASVSKAEKRRAALVDSAICGIPMVPYILLQIVAQAQAPYQRFDILQGAGCRASLRDSAAASFLAYAPPLVLGCMAIVYALLSIRVALIEGDDLAKIFAPYRRLDATRYARLTGLTLAALCLSVPATAVSIKAVPVQARLAALSPTSGVGEIAHAAWAADGTVHAAVELGRWLGPACALLVFVFLGLGKAATAQYIAFGRAVSTSFWNALARMGYTRPLPRLPGQQPRPRRRPNLRIVNTGETTGAYTDLYFGSASTTKPPHELNTTFAPPPPPPPAKPKPQPLAQRHPGSPPPLPSASSGRSFVLATPSATEPGKFEVPPYRGWHHFSDPREVEVIRGEPHEMKPLPTIPRGRTIA